MKKTLGAAAFLAAASLVAAGAATAEPQAGTTLAGGNNGADAKADATMKSGEGTMTKGAPNAPVAPGQSTEHTDGKMRAQKNF